MEKVIDLTRSIKELCTEYPEIKDIMKELGFENITNPTILNTAGRFMTIPKGAEMKNIDIEVIKQEFRNKGFIIKE